MKTRALVLVLSISGLLGLARDTEAQVTGSIYGVVKDASGGVLPGATVTATSPALQRESVSAATNEAGAYRISLLPAGVYVIRVELSGFNNPSTSASAAS